MASGTQRPNPEPDVLWKQYALHIDLYKFYLDLLIKVTVFYYAITGGILTYYFQHWTDGVARFAVVLPIVFSVAIGVLFLYGAHLMRDIRADLFSIRDRLGLAVAPDVRVLAVSLRFFGAILFLTGLALGTFFVWKCM